MATPVPRRSSTSPGDASQGTHNTGISDSIGLPPIEEDTDMDAGAPNPADSQATAAPSGADPSHHTSQHTPYPEGHHAPSHNTSQRPRPGDHTPLPGTNHRRGDVQHAQRRPNVARQARSGPSAAGEDEDLPPAQEADDVDTGTHIWGTNINQQALEHSVKLFLDTFMGEDEGYDDMSKPKYHAIVEEAIRTQDLSVNLDTADIRAADPRLYEWIVDFPRETFPVFDETLRQIAVHLFDYMPDCTREEATRLCNIACRPFNLSERKTIRDLDPSDIDKLVCIQGMVTRTSAIIPNLLTAVFKCAACTHELSINNDNGKVAEPSTCPACNRKWSLGLQHNLGLYLDKQLVKMQEAPDNIPEGETPMGVSLYTYDVLVDVCKPGDRVTITGTYRAAPLKVNPNQTAYHALFKTYIDVNHVQKEESRRLFSVAGKEEEREVPPTPARSPGPSQDDYVSQQPSRGEPGPPLSNESADDQFVALESITADQLRAQEAQFQALAADPRLTERLVASLAPNIWEMEDVKKGVLCQLFGGTAKTFPGGRIRGEVNALLVGDPSVSKSQLLTYVHKLAPRGIYTSGKGSSAVGLTAYVAKDPETREMVLESGALVLSDRGVCCIDEFDKMSDSARSMLHEAMEQQTVSVAKAGLISTLNARCSILACANPIGSRYNPAMSIAENINLPPTLLSRFDLIYLVLDKYQEERDRRLARHLTSLFYLGADQRSRVAAADLIPIDVLKPYIAYARMRCSPKITDEAALELVQRYQMLRRDGREKRVVIATPRQLESLIRISESLARMRLSSEVTKDDVAEAVRLWYAAMSGSAASANGGIDLDNVMTGTTNEAREAAKHLPAELRQLIAGMQFRTTLSVDDLGQALQKKMADAGKAGRAPGRQALLVALRQLDDLLILDENGATVRPRAQHA